MRIVFILVVFHIKKDLAKVYLCVKTISFKEIGHMIVNMMVCKLRNKDIIKAVLKMMLEMVKENFFGKTEKNIKDNGGLE
jgi:hypothetical protein